MRIVVGTERLEAWGGTETYVLTLADHLQRLGHDVEVLARRGGPPLRWAREHGIRAATIEPHDVPPADLLISNTTAVALELSSVLPGAKHIWVGHSTLSPLQRPPGADMVPAGVALNDRVARWAAGAADAPPITRLCQPIDTRRFFPAGPLRDRARRVLLLGNHPSDERGATAEAAARAAGLDVVRIGASDGQHDAPELVMAEVDIVMGYGRSILEGMACGRAAYVFDRFGGDGWVTQESYQAMEADGFAGGATDDAITLERLTEDLRAFSPEMGVVNRDLVVSSHRAEMHAAAMVSLAQQQSTSPDATGRPVGARTDLASAVRAMTSFVEQIDGQNRHVFVLAARISELEAERDRLRGRNAELESEPGRERERVAELDAELARAREALAADGPDAAWGREVRSSKRFRMTQAVLTPFDRFRRRGERSP